MGTLLETNSYGVSVIDTLTGTEHPLFLKYGHTFGSGILLVHDL